MKGKKNVELTLGFALLLSCCVTRWTFKVAFAVLRKVFLIGLWERILARLKDALLRATSVIFLLGVGSFVCYKLYRQLRQRLKRKDDASTLAGRKAKLRGWIAADGKLSAGTLRELCCIKECFFGPSFESDNESELSESSRVDSQSASSGDADSSSSCGSLSDLEDSWNMGANHSNPYEPVHFNSHSGDVRFRGVSGAVQSSAPLDIQIRGSAGALAARHRRNQSQHHRLLAEKRPKGLVDEKLSRRAGGATIFDDIAAALSAAHNNNKVPPTDGGLQSSGTHATTEKEGLFDSLSFEADAAPWERDTDSLQANFSVGSLTERSRRTEELLAQRCNSVAAEVEEEDNFSGLLSDSALLRFQSVNSSRQMSVDSEASDMSVFEAAHVEMSCEAVVAMDQLETLLLDTKQELLDLDAELVSLKVFRKRLSERDYRLVPSIDDESNNESVAKEDSLLNVVNQHKTLIRSRGLLDEAPGAVAQERQDSGSDFGNSLESDNDRVTKDGVSLEWDSTCLPSRRGSDSADGISEIGSDVSESRYRRPDELFQWTGHAQSPGMLREQIKKVIRSDPERRRNRIVRSQTAPADQLCAVSEMADGDVASRHLAYDSGSTRDAPDCLLWPEPSPTIDSSVSDFALLEASSPSEALPDPNGNNLSNLQNRCVEMKDSGYDSVYGDVAETIGDRCTVTNCVKEMCWQVGQNYDERCVVSALLDLSATTARQIRCDGYSAIRGAAFGILASGGSLLTHHGGAEQVYQILINALSSENGSWLRRWQFPARLKHNGSCLEGFWECLSCLQTIEDQLKDTNSADKEYVLAALLNKDPVIDAQISDAVKLVMLKCALELYEDQVDEVVVPMFATVMFSRESSRTPEDFLLNHLNRIGSEGIQEVELYLLGYALETTVTIVRPQRVRSGDLVCRYPEWQVGVWPEVLLSEIDGRYCVFGR
ncbi:uncharacterized protein LOC135390890 isoform X2 [Ornithodoros turicata]|uniref:uncharacterized protein LOC135390890 isoform X2 n=1 Tax=Ornithodoros turicata TaxID=34597 RepID=UPI00313A1227